jgi:hypothetical protein
MNKETTNPLILVFYLEKEAMSNKRLITPFVESINQMIYEKEANVMAFFLPTNGNQRVECINPVIVAEADMEKINKMIEDIKVNFSINADMDIPDEEIILDDKPCECGMNPDGNCKCE